MRYLFAFLITAFSISAVAALDPARRMEFAHSQGTYSDSQSSTESALRYRTPVVSNLDFGLDFSQREVFGEKGMIFAPFAVWSASERTVLQGGGILGDSSPVYPVSQFYLQGGYKWLESRSLITYLGAGRTSYVQSAYEDFIVAEVVWYSSWGLILQGGNRFVKSEPLGDTYGRLYAVATYQTLKAAFSVRHDRGREAYQIVDANTYKFNFESSSTSLQARVALPENFTGIVGLEFYESEALTKQTWSLGLGVGF